MARFPYGDAWTFLLPDITCRNCGTRCSIGHVVKIRAVRHRRRKWRVRWCCAEMRQWTLDLRAGRPGPCCEIDRAA